MKNINSNFSYGNLMAIFVASLSEFLADRGSSQWESFQYTASW